MHLQPQEYNQLKAIFTYPASNPERIYPALLQLVNTLEAFDHSINMLVSRTSYTAEEQDRLAGRVRELEHDLCLNRNPVPVNSVEMNAYTPIAEIDPVQSPTTGPGDGSAQPNWSTLSQTELIAALLALGMTAQPSHAVGLRPDRVPTSVLNQQYPAPTSAAVQPDTFPLDVITSDYITSDYIIDSLGAFKV